MPQDYTLIGGNGTVVSPLEVTEDGTYKAGDSRAYNPVIVRTGGGGSSTLAGLTDVDLSNPSDGQTLVYDAASSKWVNGSGSGGGLIVLEGTLENNNITLTQTAQELAELMETNIVFVKFLDVTGGTPVEHFLFVGAVATIEDVDYGFNLFGEQVLITDRLAPSDTVVFNGIL